MDPIRAAIAAALTLTFLAAIYAAACWVRPFADCAWCSGTGDRVTLIRRRLGPCRWCHGGGQRLRVGRRIYNAVTRRRAAAAVAARRLP
jgi:hypothetical protein